MEGFEHTLHQEDLQMARKQVQTCPAGVQPWQDPGDTLRMNGVGERERERERERRHVRPALIGPSLRMTRESDQMGGAESGNALFFTIAFIH